MSTMAPAGLHQLSVMEVPQVGGGLQRNWTLKTGTIRCQVRRRDDAIRVVAIMRNFSQSSTYAVNNSLSVTKDTETTKRNVRQSRSYRPVVILPGLGNNTGDYTPLVSALEDRDLSATVVRVSRPDWLRNAAGLFDGKYWRGTLQPRPVLDWYLQRLSKAIAAAKASYPDGRKVSLIGHSAGGWLARVYMDEFGLNDIALLLTLGTPHLPPPRGVPGVFDQTRGLLYHIEERCPGAYHSPDVKYVCVAGRYLKGGSFALRENVNVATTGVGIVSPSTADGSKVPDVLSKAQVQAAPTFRDRLVGQGYKQVCGQADVWGDGVVPEISAHLEGAINISVDGVYHSPVGSTNDERPWYGSQGVIDKWIGYLWE